jgi:hypothetical protein
MRKQPRKYFDVFMCAFQTGGPQRSFFILMQMFVRTVSISLNCINSSAPTGSRILSMYRIQSCISESKLKCDSHQACKHKIGKVLGTIILGFCMWYFGYDAVQCGACVLVFRRGSRRVPAKRWQTSTAEKRV